MTRVAVTRISAPAISWSAGLPAFVFAAGWLALYLPVYIEFAGAEWLREENAHAPFILAIAVGAAWARITSAEFRHYAERGAFLAGCALLAAGLGCYAFGRFYEATLLVSGSQVLVAAGAAIAVFGFTGAARLWFPILILAYLVIWPSWALDIMTAPLKRFVSVAVSDILFATGLPVAHTGAVITAGPYQLLVADACAGLTSLIALTAVGAVYLYMARRPSLAVNAIVLVMLAPIAIAANIVRVLVLVLITYYLGYDAGQSFLHETAGLVMFAAALAGVFLVDIVAATIFMRRR